MTYRAKSLSIQTQPRLALFPKQAEIFKHRHAIRIVRKGRRAGFTHGAAIYMTLMALTGGYKRMLWGDTIYGNIKRYIQLFFVEHLKHYPKRVWHWDKSANTLRIENTIIDFRSADNPYNWEGFSYDFVYINEAGIVLRDDYIWQNAVLPMLLDHDGTAVVAGTPKGKNFFYELYKKAIDPLNERYVGYVATAYDNPLIKKKNIDDLAADLPEMIRAQEIFGEFVDNSGTVFTNVSNRVGAYPAEPEPYGMYYIGVDVAQKDDFTVIKVIDANGTEVYSERFNKLPYPEQTRRIKRIADKYNNAFVTIDVTGVGAPIYDSLESEDVNVAPFTFTNKSKLHIIQNLVMAFEKEEITLIDDPVTINELTNFEFEITVSGNMKLGVQKNIHDDCVIALALAWYSKNYTPNISYAGF